MKKYVIGMFLWAGLSVLITVLTTSTSALSQSQLQPIPSDPDQSEIEEISTPRAPSIAYSYHIAGKLLSMLPRDATVEFPVGINNSTRSVNRVAIGYVDRDGNPQLMKVSDLLAMSSAARNNGGTLDTTSERQARRATLNLVVFNPQNNQRYVVPNVRANAVNRDAINAVLSGNLRINNDVRR